MLPPPLDALCNGKNDSDSRKTVLRQHSYRSAVRALNASSKWLPERRSSKTILASNSLVSGVGTGLHWFFSLQLIKGEANVTDGINGNDLTGLWMSD